MDDSQLPPDDASGSITMLYQQWRKGHSDSLNELISRFRPRLLALAHSTLRGRVQRAADAEDALQSAMISFWGKVDNGGFEHEMDRDDLWNVLGVFTVRKALKLQERERAQKRGGGQVVTGLSLENSPDKPSTEGLDLVCGEMLEMLDPDLRSFALMRLMGHKNREIAEEFGCTERKVERKLNLVRAVWEEEVELWNK
jgi:DNA-directed RNA polymerase specialized sigma24 family protein